MLKSKIYFSATSLKFIAIIFMFFDHFVAVLMPHSELLSLILRIPGRISAPIMCYFIAEGYHYTSNKAKYFRRLFVLALISHIPYVFLFNYSFFKATSILWSLALGLFSLWAWESEYLNTIIKIAVIGITCFLAIPANWNFIAVLWILFFGIYHGSLKNQLLSFSVIGLIFHLVPNYIRFGPFHGGYPHLYQAGIFLAIPLLLLYDGTRGKHASKFSRFFYGFYPGHLVFIHLLNIYTPLKSIIGDLI